MEVLGSISDYELHYVSAHGGAVSNHQGIRILTEARAGVPAGGILLVPGGMGTRRLVGEGPFIDMLRRMAEGAEYVLTVCTGAALLARTGLLDGRAATSNHRAMAWVMEQGGAVRWRTEASYVASGKYYTAAGVSAGIDMALAFVADRFGASQVRAIAQRMEYGGKTSMPH